ncbi:distal tail protein Dit [Peribacillus sp. NPDC096448]|uniref:distal tail protein Dit n=1 Tax=Peribacillus sp. NPDC096448 TaxID=3364395 RepID=UPI00381912D2
MTSVIFCGIDLEKEIGLIINEIKRPVTPEITETTQDVPGMVGSLFLGNNYGQRVFDIEITIKAQSESERVQKIHRLAELTMTFGDGEFPMIFGHESDITYYGHFTNITIPERLALTHWATCTLTFSCSDPKGYGEYETNDMTENPTTITPNGTDECYPTFTCIPKKDVTKIAVTDEDGNYVFLGSEVDPDTGNSPIDKEPLVLADPCNTLATWTKITSSTLTWPLDNGVIGGEMTSSPNSLLPGKTSDGYANFGPPAKDKWHGPLRLQWLPGSYNDYRVRVRFINQQSYNRAQGKVEMYLLDANGSRMGKLMLKDNGTESKVVYAGLKLYGSTDKDLYYGPGTLKRGKSKTRTIKVGNGTKKVKEKGKTKTVQLWKTVKLDEDLDTSTFTNFYGYIELEKIGNKYRFNIMKLDDNSNPAWKKPITQTWTDTKNAYTRDLAGVAFYVAKWDIYEDTTVPVTHYRNNDMRLCDLRVWNIIDGGDGSDLSKPTVIARKGDEVKINCEDRTIYKNGDFFMKKLYIGSDFPTMKGGIPKTFAFEPDLADADWYVEYRPTTN